MGKIVDTHSPTTFSIATEHDRNTIYRLRHEIYASELSQHQENQSGMLRDPLDKFNTYIIASRGEELIGFISITPPGFQRYSVSRMIAILEQVFSFTHP